MRFRGIKQLIGGDVSTSWRELSDALRDLFTGLTRLSLADNFESFEITNETIASGTTKTFANKLSTIPTRYIIVRNSAGMAISDNGFSGWNSQTVSLKNVGASSTIISVIFLR
jgi:hypothetical protein